MHVNGLSEPVIILLFNVELIQSLIHCSDISVLDGYKVRFHQRKLSSLKCDRF